LELLGSGGMGEVYKARQTDLGSTVALKWLRPEMVPNAVAVQRLQAEAKSLASLNHPSIPKISRIEHLPEGGMFVVMEYIDGISLDKEIERRGKLPAAETIEIVSQIADALSHAHKNGIVHRDVKPSNIIVASTDNKLHVYLLDFGIAKQVQSAQKFTQTGALVGSVRYMSPEQASGGTVDPTTDVYSLGCLTYEMLTGKAPYDGESPMEILMQHVQSTVPKIEDSALNEVLMKAMAKAPSDRFGSTDEFAQALQAPHTVAPTIRKRHGKTNKTIKTRLLASSIATAGVFIVFGAWYVFNHKQPLKGMPTKTATTEQDQFEQQLLDSLGGAINAKAPSSPGLEQAVATVNDSNVPMQWHCRALGLEYAGRWRLECGRKEEGLDMWDKIFTVLHQHNKSAGVPAVRFADVLSDQRHTEDAEFILEESINFDKKNNLDNTWESVDSQICYGAFLSDAANPVQALRVFEEVLKNSPDARQRAYAELWIADINSKNGNDPVALNKASEWLKRTKIDSQTARFVPWAEFLVLKSTHGLGDASVYFNRFNELFDKQIAAILAVQNTEHQFYTGGDIRFMYGTACYIGKNAYMNAEAMVGPNPSVESTKRVVWILKKYLDAAERFDSGWRAAVESDYQVWSARLQALESHR